MSTRTYVREVTTATTGVAIQLQKKGRIKVITANLINAAAGYVEISFSPSSLLASSDPGPSVIGRACAGVTPFAFFKTECDIPVEPFQQIYLHETGAANAASVSIVVAE